MVPIPSEASETSSLSILAAVVCLIWYIVVLSLASLGIYDIFTKFSKSKHVPHVTTPVTVLRPLKGIDAEMTACLESCILQDYPRELFEVIFCVEDHSDPAVAVVEQLIAKYPTYNLRLLMGQGHCGVNPKVNNLIKGYNAAKYDLVWVCDSNVWVPPGTLARSVHSMVNSLDNGVKTSRKVVLTHQVPLAVSLVDRMGSRLDEMFLSTSHAKFYVAFNKLSVAPCVNGKSNFYRRSAVGDLSQFAKYIGEDNMIGIHLWDQGRTGMTGDVVIQPLVYAEGVRGYIDRRVRWLRVRKYMVLAATLLEPTTESIVIGMMGAFAVGKLFGWPSFTYFLGHMIVWCAIDRLQYRILIANVSIESKDAPSFIRNMKERSLGDWLKFWLMRELLALPIWIKAMCGHVIDWRGRPFRIKSDLSAEAL